MRPSHLVLATLAIGCAPAGSSAQPDGLRLSFPVACRIGETCEIQNYVDRDPGPGAQDYRCGTRTYQAHNGVDIRLKSLAAQRAGVAVLAAAPGKVARVRDGVADVSVRATCLSAVEGRECGNAVVLAHDGGWETQYCHMAMGSVSVKPGQAVAAGQPIGKVGLSGQTEYPHLHLSVRRAGAMVDPFAPTRAAGCGADESLWSPEARRQMGYKRGAVLNAGFAGGPVSSETIESGVLTKADRSAAALVAYVRAIGLEAGDAPVLVLTGPGGERLAESSLPPLDRAKAQHVLYIGKKRPAQGWKPGTYEAHYRVQRSGGATLETRWRLTL